MTLVPASLFALGPLLEATLRSTALIALAALAALALRRAPAAVRHLVWTLAIIGSVAMPLAARVVPGWSLPGLSVLSARPEPSPPPAPAPVEAGAAASGAAGAGQPRSQASVAEPAHQTPPSSAATAWRPSRADVIRLLPLAWFAGAMLLLARYLLGWIRLSRLASRAAPMDDHVWQVALAKHGATLRIRRLPALRVSPRVAVPVVCGAWRPIILLPVTAGEWPAERRDAVLLHEMAHVERLDLITARVTQLASTLYWFNPIVWLAARAQRSEAERACDDQVLDAGGRASAYASDLLEIARAVGGCERLDTAALAMARRSQLEGRLLAILDPRLRRGGARPTTVLVAVLVAVGAIGAIAAGRPARSEHATQVEAAAAAGQPVATAAADQVVAAAPSVGAQTAVHRADGPLAAADKKRAVDGLQGTFIDDDGRSMIGNWNHRDGRGTLLTQQGKVRYSGDLDDIESISPGGRVEIEDKRGGTWHKATFKGRAGGIERAYQVDGVEHPWDASARAWLAEFLIDLDRGSGVFVEQRFPRLMTEGGPDRVLREVSLMTSDYGRGLYLRKLFASGLEDAAMRRAVAQAGREIESDYELTQALIDAAEHHALEDAATRTAYLEAANTLESDYEHGRALMALVERPELSPGLVDGAIASATKMESDYEQAQVMIAMAEKGHVKTQAQRAFIRATKGLDSDYERGRVLGALLEGDRLAGENVGELLLATAPFSSDYERANVLVQLARSTPLTEAQRKAFVESTRAMSSDHERQRALAALAGTLSR